MENQSLAGGFDENSARGTSFVSFFLPVFLLVASRIINSVRIGAKWWWEIAVEFRVDWRLLYFIDRWRWFYYQLLAGRVGVFCWPIRGGRSSSRLKLSGVFHWGIEDSRNQAEKCSEFARGLLSVAFSTGSFRAVALIATKVLEVLGSWSKTTRKVVELSNGLILATGNFRAIGRPLKTALNSLWNILEWITSLIIH